MIDFCFVFHSPFISSLILSLLPARHPGIRRRRSSGGGAEAGERPKTWFSVDGFGLVSMPFSVDVALNDVFFFESESFFFLPLLSLPLHT